MHGTYTHDPFLPESLRLPVEAAIIFLQKYLVFLNIITLFKQLSTGACRSPNFVEKIESTLKNEDQSGFMRQFTLPIFFFLL
jgi:hypothetical protein